MLKVYFFSFIKDVITGIFWVYWAVSLISHGATLPTMALYLGVLYICWAVCELPTGLFADRFGRKLSSLTGVGLLLVGFLCKLLPENNILQFFTFPLSGVGLTFLSGASTVWLAQVAAEEHKIKKSEFIFTSQIMGRFAVMASSLVGGWIYTQNNRALWIAAALLSSVLLSIGIMIPEHVSASKETVTWKDLSVSAIRGIKDPVILWILAGACLYGFEQGVRNLIWTPYLLDLKSNNTEWVGNFNATLAAVRLVGLLLYRFWIGKRFDSIASAYVFLVVGLVGLALAEVNAALVKEYWAFVGPYAAAMLVLGWYFAFRDIVLVQVTHQKSQATVFSAISCGENLLAALGCFTIVGVISASNIASGWIVGAVALGISAIYYGLSARAFLNPNRQSA